MSGRARRLCLALALVAAGSPAAAAAPNRPIMPFELARSLQLLQEAVANGSGTAQGAQRKLLAIMAERFLKADPAVWQDRKNATAAMLHALSGGNPSVLKTLIGRAQFPEADKPLLDGVLAYAEGRNADAAALLADIDATALAPSIGGYLAIAQSALTEPADVKRAARLLATARLLMPGTLVEEAALRREIVMAVKDGEIEKFEHLSRQQFTRFGRSIYTSGFRIQFADAVVALDYSKGPDRLAILDGMLASLAPPLRHDLYLLIARKALIAGMTPIARFAAERAAATPTEQPKDALRAELYAAISLIVTDDFDSALKRLKHIDAKALGEEDAQLLGHALSLAARLHEPPAVAADGLPVEKPRQPHHHDVAGDGSLAILVERAAKAMARADELLREGGS